MDIERSVPVEIQRASYERTKGICVICGKPLSRYESKWTVDHFIPRAVYKWVPDKKIKRITMNRDNLLIVHGRCNLNKGSVLPTNRMIDEMYAEEDVKESLRRLYKKAEENIIRYRAIKQSTLDSQDKRCAACGRRISLNHSVMRRVDDSQPRSRENAMCMCEKCNIRACAAKRKGKTIRSRKKYIWHKEVRG